MNRTLRTLYMRKTQSQKSWSQNVKRVSQTVWEIQSGLLFAVNSSLFFALHKFVQPQKCKHQFETVFFVILSPEFITTLDQKPFPVSAFEVECDFTAHCWLYKPSSSFVDQQLSHLRWKLVLMRLCPFVFIESFDIFLG